MGKIGICSDHAGFVLKAEMISHLEERGYEVVDFGCHSSERMDYPDVAHPLAEAVEKGEVEKGVAMCGTGNGMAMTLNKHRGIRAGLAWSVEIAALTKEHNNANIIVLPARFIEDITANQVVDAWLDSTYEGGRHQNRLDKMPLK